MEADSEDRECRRLAPTRLGGDANVAFDLSRRDGVLLFCPVPVGVPCVSACCNPPSLRSACTLSFSRPATCHAGTVRCKPLPREEEVEVEGPVLPFVSGPWRCVVLQPTKVAGCGASTRSSRDQPSRHGQFDTAPSRPGAMQLTEALTRRRACTRVCPSTRSCCVLPRSVTRSALTAERPDRRC